MRARRKRGGRSLRINACEAPAATPLLYICIYIGIYLSISLYICIHVCVCLCVFVCVRVCVRIYVCRERERRVKPCCRNPKFEVQDENSSQFSTNMEYAETRKQGDRVTDDTLEPARIAAITRLTRQACDKAAVLVNMPDM